MRFNTKKLAAIICCAAAMSGMQIASADDQGTLTFNGMISDNTCDVAVNGGTADATIKLPTVSANTLAAQGDTTGRVFVRMDLSNCGLVSVPGDDPTATEVYAFWQASPDINLNGRLLNTDTGAGAATNVEIQMLNDSMAAIDLAKADGAQNTSIAQITAANTAELVHYAQYFATGASTPGTVASKLEYVISYN